MDGAQLPAKFEPFPADLLGKPIEELDQYVYEKVRKEGNDQMGRDAFTGLGFCPIVLGLLAANSATVHPEL